MTISKAEKKDIPELVHLLHLLFSEEKDFTPDSRHQVRGLTLILEDPAIGTIYTVRENGRITGMVSILKTISTACGCPAGVLEDMIIHPDFRRRGQGTALLRYALAEAEKEGLGRITLLTDGDNEKALPFYRAMGFEKSTMIPLRKSLKK